MARWRLIKAITDTLTEPTAIKNQKFGFSYNIIVDSWDGMEIGAADFEFYNSNICWCLRSRLLWMKSKQKFETMMAEKPHTFCIFETKAYMELKFNFTCDLNSIIIFYTFYILNKILN